MFQTTWVCVIAAIAVVPTHVKSEVINPNESCAVLYEKGVEAYLDNNYNNCVKYFEAAVEKYRIYIKTLQNCRIQCKENVSEDRPLYTDNLEDLHFFEKTLKNTLCILKCRKEHGNVFGLYNINKETEKLFEDRKPYEYLHICYFQTKDYPKAASSAFTYLVAHPDDKPILASLKHYTSFPEADPSDVINYEAKEFVYLYVHGSDAYDKENWERVVQNMEESLVLYLQAEEECRAQCEGPYDPGWYPDFIPSIANHFTYCLKCKRKCRNKLSSLNGEKHEDLLPSHYHYLQYAYYKLGKLKSACQAVASYLLFYPDDHDMKRNVQYYKSLPEVSEKYFTPRAVSLGNYNLDP
ncbi:hypothetical protein AMK59_7679 [Oryctes borbonicus]|uniref:Leprecan-like alpha-helical domain-containing protein n=1 Tax=Oryctes borbonicus TaxID=1629725 RepID=A0A0T6AWX4_9SCAR|nr:hypothetical protein AMK59_7679 [Oryctes borbonicus]